MPYSVTTNSHPDPACCRQAERPASFPLFCHPDRSGPTFSFAPISGASGRGARCLRPARFAGMEGSLPDLSRVPHPSPASAVTVSVLSLLKTENLQLKTSLRPAPVPTRSGCYRPSSSSPSSPKTKKPQVLSTGGGSTQRCCDATLSRRRILLGLQPSRDLRGARPIGHSTSGPTPKNSQA